MNIYPVSESETPGEPAAQIDVSSISIEKLKQLVAPNNADLLLYDGYLFAKEQIDMINQHIHPKIKPGFTPIEYCLECYGIYEKQK